MPKLFLTNYCPSKDYAVPLINIIGHITCVKIEQSESEFLMNQRVGNGGIGTSANVTRQSRLRRKSCEVNVLMCS